MTTICATRKFFEPFPDEYNLGKFHGGECNSEKFVDYSDETNQPPDDGLGYSDFEGYSANFKVGSKFGCIHFKEKIGED